MNSSLSRIMLRRAWFGNWVYPLLFGLSLWVSLAAYLTLDSLQQSVDDYIDGNQKAMVGGDLILQTQQEWPEDIRKKLAQLNADDLVYDYQFNAMLYANDQSLLARIKAVTEAYPLYGQVELASKMALWQQLKPGFVVVEAQVLVGLGLQIGDTLKLGEAEFTIADELITEPDRPLTAFGFGARVLMTDVDLAQTQLMGQRSRVSYRAELALSDSQLDLWQSQLKNLIGEREITLSTAAEANTSLSNVSANFLVFLKLLVVAVVILSGVGLLSVMKAFIRRQQNTNAIRRALGEQMAPIKRSYYALFLLMAVLASAVAYVISELVLYFGGDYFAAFLPADISIQITLLSVFKVSLIAVLMTLLVTHQSLRLLAQVKPVAVLQQHKLPRRSSSTSVAWYVGVVVGIYLLITLELNSFWLALQITAGLLLVLLIFWLLSLALLKLMAFMSRRGFIKHWLTRLAMQNIFRKGNHSVLFFTTLSLAVMVMMMINVLNHSIDQQLVSTYPEDAPNMFLLDVQSDQHQPLNALINAPVTYYPVVRARIESVNGVATATLKEQLGTYDDISRIFNLSYSDSLMETEYLKSSLQGERLFTDFADEEVVSLSILASIAEYLQVGLGDEVTFNIQGIPMTGRVSSIRARFERGPNPFFYFIFQPEVLKNAPQIQFATTKVNAEQVPVLQTEIAKTFPGITTLNGAAIAQQVKTFVAQLTRLVQIFTGLSVVAGLMVLLTSLLSTSQDRLQDSAYFRLLGMRSRDLYAINIIEMWVLGLLAAMVGSLLAFIAAYFIVTEWFNLHFSIPWASTLVGLLVLSGILFIVAVLYGRMVIGRQVMAKVRQLV